MKTLGAWVYTAVVVFSVRSDAGATRKPERDLAYGPDPSQRLDLWVPSARPSARGFPTVLFIHGGSLTSGDKADEDYRDVCLPFPAAGIACANVNYRLGPQHSWPAQAQDVAAAVAWVRANIAQRGGDPQNLVLMGHSSGAMLVALVGTDERYLAPRCTPTWIHTWITGPSDTSGRETLLFSF